MPKSTEWLEIGKIVAPQGLKGELRVNPSSDFPERFTKPGERWIQQTEEAPRKIELVTGRNLPGKSIYVIRFKGIHDRNAAELLVGNKLLVPSSNRPKLKDGEFHLLDLIGLEAKFQSQGPAIGLVTDLKTGGNDLLEIQLDDGKRVLIPFVKEIVPEVHLKEGWLKLTPPNGLLEL